MQLDSRKHVSGKTGAIQLRRERQLCAWQVSNDPTARPLVTLIYDSDIDWSTADNVYGTFKTKRQALKILNKLADEYGLCDKALGLEKGSGVWERIKDKYRLWYSKLELTALNQLAETCLE